VSIRMDDWTDGQRDDGMDDGMDDGPDGFRGGFISHPHVLYNILVATENLLLFQIFDFWRDFTSKKMAAWVSFNCQHR